MKNSQGVNNNNNNHYYDIVKNDYNKVMVIPTAIDALGIVTKGLVKRLEELEIRVLVETIQTIALFRSAEKRHGNLRRLVVTRTPMKNHQLTLVWKTLKREMNTIIKIKENAERQVFGPFKKIKTSIEHFYHLGFLENCLHLYCYFHNVSVDMSSGLLQVFVELGNLHGTSNYILYWIHGGRLFWFR